jgi:hypothetical protein
MLTLYTNGYNYSKRRCTKVVKWFISKTLPRHHLEIVVNHRGMMRHGVYGWVGVTDCDYRPRSFEIEMHNQMTIERYTKTLLHELWHVNQHVKGALKDKYGKRHWRGTDHSLTDYSDQPWEKQAFIMEEVLYEEYLNHLTDTHQSL